MRSFATRVNNATASAGPDLPFRFDLRSNLGRLGAMDKKNEVTRLLLAWSDGDKVAFDRLMVVLEGELRKIARRYMASERPDHTLETMALVNEMCLRLLDRDSLTWKNSAQFRAFAANTMKLVLVDHARKHLARIRNEGLKPLPIDELRDLPMSRDRELVELADSLQGLSRINERQSCVVELHYFGGLTCTQIGADMGFSEATAKRALVAGRAWLRREMARETG